jgi:hypothetical protein
MIKKDKNEVIKSNSRFADPARIKIQKEMDTPENGKNSPWDFRCPQYDQRSSSFINAGTHYGIGINQPIGHKGNPKSKVDVLPMGRVNTMRIDEAG